MSTRIVVRLSLTNNALTTWTSIRTSPPMVSTSDMQRVSKPTERVYLLSLVSIV